MNSVKKMMLRAAPLISALIAIRIYEVRRLREEIYSDLNDLYMNDVSKGERGL